MNEKQKNYPLIKSKKLLNEDNNAKTVKGQKLNYMTAILYLASSDNSGFNVCSEASEGCRLACLYSAGHGAFTNVQNGRINKTRWYFLERETFLIQLKKEISAFIVKAEKKGFKPCIRLNGTSDIPWENHDIIQSFPNVQFYDYSKSYKRALKFINGELPKNYHITYSLCEDNKEKAFNILKLGGNISAVFRKYLPKNFKGFNVLNADETDLRFLDIKNSICGLVAKGKAKKDYSGFVLDTQ
jgi:hypothetical protein